MASNLGYVYKNTKLDGESMSDWKRGWDKLTDADKAELLAEAEKFAV